MAKTLVAYFSKTGNTKKIAKAILQALPEEKEIARIGETGELEAYSLVFIGFPVLSHSIPYPVEEFLKKIPKNKKTALFSTHGSLPGSRLSREAIEYASVVAGHAQILGSYSCRGKVSLEALDALRKSPEHEAWADMAASARNHPDSQDIENARAFVRWIRTLYSQPKK